MKQYPYIQSTLLGLVGLTLACWPEAATAQTSTILMPPGAIQPNGDPTDNTLQWGQWWTGSGTETEVLDTTVSSLATIPGSIHITMSCPGNGADPGTDANLAFGDFIGEGPNNNGWLGAYSPPVDASKYSALSFDILINNETCSNTDIPIYLWGASYDDVQIGTVNVPGPTNALGSNIWQHVSVPIPATIVLADCTAWGFYNWYPNAAPFNAEFWIDNVQLVGKGVIPAPKMSIAPAVQGLNLFAGTGTGLYNREDLESPGGLYSWVGASGPVSFSFTITDYPIGTNDAFQISLFLCPDPGTESAVDWTEPNIIFIDLESWVPNGGGANWNFRYKTNDGGANDMIFGTNIYGQPGTLATIGTNTAIGTWTVTFNNDTNVTMIIPGGASTNFDIPDATGATATLFASDVYLYFGVQANAGVNNSIGATSDHIVASEFKVTGLGSADFDDNFIADAGTLDTNLWTVNAAYPACVKMVGPGDHYWDQWTLPAENYSLLTTPALAPPVAWTPVTTHLPFSYGIAGAQLISTNDAQPGRSAFFALVQRTFSQLQILLPGETNAPGTSTGKTGTPTPVSLGNDNQEIFTVLTVDKDFYPVTGSYDTIQITTTDTGAIVPFNNPTLADGTLTVNTFFFEDEGTFTISAADVTTT